MSTHPRPVFRGNAVFFGLLLCCSFLWANSFLLMKVIATSLSPLALTAVRGVMGGALLGAWVLLARQQSLMPRGRELRDWAALGLLQGIIPNTLTAYALTQITAGLMTMIQATTPLVLAVIAHFVLSDERMTTRRAVGILVGFTGMALLIGPNAFGREAGPLGVLASAATTLSYSCASLYIRAIPDQQPARLAFGQQIFAGFPTLALTLLLSGPAAFAAVPDNLLFLTLLGVFGTAVPIVLFMTIIKMAGPILGSMNGYLIPPWTVLLGFLLLGETVSLGEVLACLVVFAGIVIISTAPAARPAPAAPQT